MYVYVGFPWCLRWACNAGDLGSIPGLGRSPEGKNYPLHYSDLENSMDCIVHGVTKNQTRLSDFHSLTHSHMYMYMYMYTTRTPSYILYAHVLVNH